MMISGAMGESSRHLRDLFIDGTAVGLGDGQLLARYALDRDEAAFEALVARHGPMVVATCRAVLGREHDIEDAFQATFLVLARKARSIRAGDALGGWLHRVAYRAAVQASGAARLRRRHEADAAAVATRFGPSTGPETDLALIIHEELDRLADRQRLPVILCDLEGLTYEQAARHLGVTEPALRHRLVKARRRLRDRLARRGVHPGALGAVLPSQVAGSFSTLPAAWVRAAVAAATGGARTATAAALATAFLKKTLMDRLKIASAGFLAAIALATASVFAVGALRTDGPAAAIQSPAVAHDAAIGPGIEGRIVDLEGRPVAGAQVNIEGLWSAPDDDLGRWLEQVKDRGVRYPSEGLAPGNSAAPAVTLTPPRGGSQRVPSSPANSTATTGPDGRFRLAGVGPRQLVQLNVTGPTIATSQLYVTGRDGAETRAMLLQGLKPSQLTFHAHRFEYAAAPGKTIEGLVRDQDTGQPIAGVEVRGAVYEEHSLMPAPGIEATTDEGGHYRLVGLPSVGAYRLFVDPAAGQPYPKATFRAAGNTPAFEPVKFDVSLKRGVVVRGMVTDQVTGESVSASIDVFAFADNPYVREYPGFRRSGHPRSFAVNGRYEAVALPGRSIVGVLVGGYMPPYRICVGAEAIKGYEPQLRGFRTEPSFCHVVNYHAVAELNVDPTARSVTLNFEVVPRRSLTMNVVDPAGQPISGTTARGVSDLHSSSEYPQTTPTFEIEAVERGRPRRVTVIHQERKLIGSTYLRGGEQAPLTIRLEPYGTIMGRILGDEGRPRGGIEITSEGGAVPARPAEQGILPGGDVAGSIRIGRDGRFRIEGLVPGLQYGAGISLGFTYLGMIFRDVTVKPGEVKDLGDLKAVAHREN
jgi:RNA polymerase sigma factor (sigma-70 family)